MQHLSKKRVEPTAPRRPTADRERGARVYLAVAGMGCPNCANRVRNALLELPGVLDVEVDLPAALVSVWFDPEAATLGSILDAVDEAGRGTHHEYLGVLVDPRPRRESSGGDLAR